MKPNENRARVANKNSQPKSARPNPIQRPPFFQRPRIIAFCAAALLCALNIFVYANSLNNGFVWDDHEQVVMNASLRPDAPLLQLASPNVWGAVRAGIRERSNYYRPLQMLAYRLIAGAFGSEAGAFHAANLAFHIAVTLVSFALFYSLINSVRLAFAAAALFALHPIHTEAVDWIAALPDLGCTLCVSLAFLFFVLARRPAPQSPPIKPQRRVQYIFLALSFASFAAALLWKETAIVFPLIITAYLVCMPDPAAQLVAPTPRLLNGLKLCLPYWCILAFYFVLRLNILGFIVIRQRNWPLSPFEFALTAVNLIANYWWKLLAPIHLNAYYVFSPVHSLQDPRAIASLLFLILAVSAIVFGFRRAPLASFAALWVFITLLPVLNVYAVGRNVFAERYLYLPSIGFCLLITLLANRAVRAVPVRFRTYAGATALIAVLLLFSVGTVARNPIWKDDATLFTRTLQASPDAPFVQNMVAAMQANNASGQSSAESHYLRAISLAQNEVPPNRLEIAIAGEGLAFIYAARHDFAQALRALSQVRAFASDDPEVDAEEGLILTQAGRWPEAEAALRRAVAINPNNANVLNALGLIAWQHQGRLDEGAQYFSRALRVHTDADDFSASLHSNLGAIYGQQNRFSDAIAEFTRAVQITPNDPEYLTNLGTAFAAIGRIADARKALQAALAAAPDYDPARAVLAQIKNN